MSCVFGHFVGKGREEEVWLCSIHSFLTNCLPQEAADAENDMLKEFLVPVKKEMWERSAALGYLSPGCISNPNGVFGTAGLCVCGLTRPAQCRCGPNRSQPMSIPFDFQLCVKAIPFIIFDTHS